MKIMDKVVFAILAPFLFFAELWDNPYAQWYDKVLLCFWNAGILFLVVAPFFNIANILASHGIKFINLGFWWSILYILVMFVGDILWEVYTGWG